MGHIRKRILVTLLERDVRYDPYSAVCVVTPDIYVSHPREQEEADEGRRCRVEAVDISRFNGHKLL